MTYPTNLKKGDRIMMPVRPHGSGTGPARGRWVYVMWTGTGLRRPMSRRPSVTPLALKRFVATQCRDCWWPDCCGCMQVVICEALIAQGAL